MVSESNTDILVFGRKTCNIFSTYGYVSIHTHIHTHTFVHSYRHCNIINIKRGKKKRREFFNYVNSASRESYQASYFINTIFSNPVWSHEVMIMCVLYKWSVIPQPINHRQYESFAIQYLFKWIWSIKYSLISHIKGFSQSRERGEHFLVFSFCLFKRKNKWVD